MEISEALEFAGERNNGVLVTQKRDGRPQLSNITYADRRWCHQDLDHRRAAPSTRISLRNPQASLYVTRDDFWAYVVIEGDAELSDVATKTDDPGVDELVELLPGQSPASTPTGTTTAGRWSPTSESIVRLKPTHAYGMLEIAVTGSVTGCEGDRHVRRAEDPDAFWLPRDVAIDRQLRHPLRKQR